MVLVGLGRKSEEECRLGTNVGGDPVPADSERLPLDFGPHDRGVVCRTSGDALTARAGERFDTLRLSFRLRKDQNAHRQRTRDGDAISDVLSIEVAADGRAVPARRLVPDVPVWSGCSWVTGLYPLEPVWKADEVILRFTCPEAEVDVFAEAWLQRD
jgi:hypothetical protein